MKPALKNTTTLITGALSGMGYEITKQPAISARQIVLVARNTKKLDEFALDLHLINPTLEVYIKPYDFANKDQLASLISTIRQQQSGQQLGDIDILINVAGTVQIGFLNETNFDDINNLIKINVLALSALSHAFLPTMIKNNRGGILSFSSFFGLKILPAYAIYVGSKHFVTGFSDTLRAETTDTNILISTVYPGPVNSPFWNVENANIYSPPGFHIKLLVVFLNLSPEPVVRAVNEGISRFMPSKRKKSIQAEITNSML